MRIIGRLLLTGAVALLLVSCKSSGDTTSSPATTPGTKAGPGSTTYVGKIAGTDLSAAALVDNGNLLLYVCDGHNGKRFEGKLTADGYTAAIDGVGTLKVAPAGNSLTGTLEANGSSYPLQADPATGKAGLLWATGDKSGTPISAGWIVAADGSETGGVVTGITDGTSNLTTQAKAIPYIEQDNIIAILIGVRAPQTRVR